MIPGAMQLAVIKPRRPYSVAIDLVADANAPLEAAYADMEESPVVPAIDVMLIIRPYLFMLIIGNENLHKLYGIVKFVCIICCRYTGSVLAINRPSTIPALLINMSMRLLKCLTTVLINILSAFGVVKSNGTLKGEGEFLDFDEVNSFVKAFNLSELRPVKTTCAPWV